MVYRILSVDGGGIRGILSAQMLAEVEKLIAPTPLKDYFHMVAGTSTGSIIAAGVTTGKTGEELVRLYWENAKTIFPYWGTFSYFSPQRFNTIFKHGLSAPKFSNEGLIKVLKGQFKDEKICDVTPEGKSRPKLLTTAYDTIKREPIVFKSWRDEAWYADLKLWETCVASSSAPTFFPAYSLQSRGRSASAVDGGVAANNPTACAIAEAVRLGHHLEDIRVLSLGTGERVNPIPFKKVKNWGVLQWAGHIVDVLMDGPVDIYEYISRRILTSDDGTQRSDHYLRLQPLLSTEYLNSLLDVESQRELMARLNQKSYDVYEGIDVASDDNLITLTTLAKAYFKKGFLVNTLQDGTIREIPVREKVDLFLKAAEEVTA